jgi:hypothetical protein
MKRTRVRLIGRACLTGVLGLCLMGAPLLRLARARVTAAPPRLAVGRATPPTPHSPSERARRAALHCWARAQQEVNEERYALEDWDPEAMSRMDQERFRLQLMARDRGGNLRVALARARRAATLAQTRAEAYDSALLLARLDCEAGHHGEELVQARRLMVMAPHSPVSLLMLRRAAQCNGLLSLERRAEAAFSARTPSPDQGQTRTSSKGSGSTARPHFTAQTRVCLTHPN